MLIKVVDIDGHMSWLRGDFIVTGMLDTGSVIVIALVALGLSMDYAPFLLSRITEQHERGCSRIKSVATERQRSERVTTSGVLLLAVDFGTFCTGDLTSVKILGFCAAFAIPVDATLTCAILMLALMWLFGEWNWWAPKYATLAEAKADFRGLRIQTCERIEPRFKWFNMVCNAVRDFSDPGSEGLCSR